MWGRSHSLKYGLPALFKFKRLYLRLFHMQQYEDFVLHYLELTTIDKILKYLDVAKASRGDQIYANDGASVIVIHLAIHLLPSKYKIAKLKPLFEKRNKPEIKNY